MYTIRAVAVFETHAVRLYGLCYTASEAGPSERGRGEGEWAGSRRAGGATTDI